MSPSVAVRTPTPGKRWLPGQLGAAQAPMAPVGTGPIGGQNDPIGLKVELYLGGAWVDITPYVYAKTKIRITRGKPNEASRVQPQTCAMTLNNRDGRFSSRNPVGPYYGLLGRNTPLRVSRTQNGIRRYRFHGEVPSWPTTTDITGTDVRTPITAAGPLRRLSQGNAPLGSAMRRLYTVPNVNPSFNGSQAAPVVAYWPCEDGKNATAIGSGVPGGTAMALSGQAAPSFTQNTAFVASDPLPLLSGSIWTGTVPAYTGGVDNMVSLLLSVPATGGFNGAVVCRVFTRGTVARLDLQYLTASGGSIQMIGYSSTGTVLFTSATITNINGSPLRVQMTLQVSGANIFWALYSVVAAVGNLPGTGSATGTLTTAVIGNATSVVINPAGQLNDTAVGHIVVQYNFNQSIDDGFAILAWWADSPDITLPGALFLSRFSRLCGEQNIPAVVIPGPGELTGDTGPASFMGYQRSDTFLNLIQEPTDMALGLLYESRDQNALVIRTRQSLYNQAPKLALDFAQQQLSGPPVPADDDALTRNDITATRIGGSSATAVLSTGALSVQTPPNGVGDYPSQPQLSLIDDSGLGDHAGWRLHMGTVDQPRYPSIPINLRRSAFAASVDLMNAALTADIGDRIVVANPPIWLPPDQISQIILGYTELLGTWEHDIVFNGAPEDPYRVAVLEDAVLGHADTDGSTLAGTYPLGTETTLSVATTGAAAGSPLWTTAAGDFPFDISVGGERMTVTNITGAASPQTFTVTRSVNGVVKAQTASTDVRLWQPMYLSL